MRGPDAYPRDDDFEREPGSSDRRGHAGYGGGSQRDQSLDPYRQHFHDRIQDISADSGALSRLQERLVQLNETEQRLEEEKQELVEQSHELLDAAENNFTWAWDEVELLEQGQTLTQENQDILDAHGQSLQQAGIGTKGIQQASKGLQQSRKQQSDLVTNLKALNGDKTLFLSLMRELQQLLNEPGDDFSKPSPQQGPVGSAGHTRRDRIRGLDGAIYEMIFGEPMMSDAYTPFHDKDGKETGRIRHTKGGLLGLEDQDVYYDEWGNEIGRK